jgi:hypothetical protein
MSITTRGLTPSANSSEAQAWRRSWNRWWRGPARHRWRWSAWLTIDPSSGSPIGVANTSPHSVHSDWASSLSSV